MAATAAHLEASGAVPVAIASAVYLMCGTLRCLPLWLALWSIGHWSSGRRSWALVVGLGAGDLLVGATSGFSLGDMLYTQWHSDAVRAAVGYYGWWPTSALLVVIAAEFAEIRRTAYAVSAGTIGVGIAMFCFAPRNPDGLGAVHGIAAIQTHVDSLPVDCPSTADLLVWPEGHARQVIRADEGPVDYQIDELCARGPGRPSHVVGLIALGEFGQLNAAAFVDPTSTVKQMRAKRVLVPLGESSWGPWSAWGTEGFVPGNRAPILDFQGRVLGILICFEVLSRSLAAEAADSGAELFVVLASDAPLLGDGVAQDQWIAALSMRAAEFGRPAVRASLGGIAVVVDARGRVVRRGRVDSAEVVALKSGQ